MTLQFGAFVFGKTVNLHTIYYHHSLTLCMSTCVCLRKGWWVRVCVKERGGMREGLYVEIAMDQLKHNIELIF